MKRRSWLLALVAAAATSCARGTFESSECRPAFAIPSRSDGVDYLDFIAVGDTGSGDSNQASVADSMKGYALANPVSFVLLLGDNFYENGVSSTADPQWRTKFEDMYDAGALAVPFYAVLGNHDYRGNAAAQVAYTAAVPESRWQMPARYYQVPTQTLRDGTTIDLFAIDTNSFAAEPQQQSWLDGALDASAAHWKIVFGHHVVYSNGSHGNSAELAATLAPILSSRRADLYIAGHDHDLQVLQPEGGVRYLVSGAGSRLRATGCGANTVYAASRLGFMALRLSRHEMAVFVVLEGAQIDYCLVTARP